MMIRYDYHKHSDHDGFWIRGTQQNMFRMFKNKTYVVFQLILIKDTIEFPLCITQYSIFTVPNDIDMSLY